MDVFLAVITIFLILIALIAIVNTFTFSRLSVKQDLTNCPFISILIPARNESNTISETLKCWSMADYPNYEIILLDDCSMDDTLEIARKAAGDDPRLQIFRGNPLPPGWTGKNWACHQLYLAATGDILLFTDADVRWEPRALLAVVTEMNKTGADLLAVWPRQITKTWTERLVVPLLGFVLVGYLPIPAVHSIPWAAFAAAIGQGLVFQRKAYQAIGGHEEIRYMLVDDMAFARAIKRAHLRLRLVNGGDAVTTRMYHNWKEVRDGFAKNILGGYRDSLILLFLASIFHWSLFVFPWIWFFINPPQGIILTLLGILIRALTGSVTHQRLQDAIFLPVSVLLMTAITARAYYWFLTGGPRWKGRIYNNSRGKNKI